MCKGYMYLHIEYCKDFFAAAQSILCGSDPLRIRFASNHSRSPASTGRLSRPCSFGPWFSRRFVPRNRRPADCPCRAGPLIAEYYCAEPCSGACSRSGDGREHAHGSVLPLQKWWSQRDLAQDHSAAELDVAAEDTARTLSSVGNPTQGSKSSQVLPAPARLAWWQAGRLQSQV